MESRLPLVYAMVYYEIAFSDMGFSSIKQQLSCLLKE